MNYRILQGLVFLIKLSIGCISVCVALAEAPPELDELARQAISERLKMPAGVCFEGDPCAKERIATVAVSSGPRTGESIYNRNCKLCHATGLMGAPKKGDTALWATRLKQRGSYQKLLKNAITGIELMPARGACEDCTDDELSLAIQYMSGLKP